MMDRDQIILLASLTVFAVGVSAFVLWGPKIGSKRRRGPLIGLQNLGFTCFLNTLIQALASCYYFVEWLEQCNGQGHVTDSLLRLLKILNNHEDYMKDIDDPYPPNDVIDALKHHGWTISPGEQDAHELFHLFILTLEEEAQRSESSLTDCLSSNEESKEKVVNLETNGLLNQGDNETKKLIPNGNILNGPVLQRNNNFHMEGSDHGEPGAIKKLPNCDNNRNTRSSPFCGLLTSHLGCTKCGFKSVKYDKFDSLSLHLPVVGNMGRSTLTQLLDKFVRTELISGVACDGCNEDGGGSKETITSTSVKTLSIGKLPQCLCLHIVRTAMGPNSTPFKRQDYVEFPEYLVMDPYTRNSMIKNHKEEIGMVDAEIQLLNANSTTNPGTCNHLYRIKAVVVHKGSVDSGHFVTYRRGPIGSHTRHRCSLSSRWYYTSDADIRESTLCEALQATAYMLFYEKCALT